MILLLLSFFFSMQTGVDSLVSRGIACHDAGRFDEAVVWYGKALEVDPDAPAALYELSVTLIEMGDYQPALDCGSRLVALNNEYSPLGYNIKGSCLNNLRRYDEAIEVLIEGINKYEGISLLHFNLALAYFAKKDFRKAQDAFTESIYLDPGSVTAHLNLARTMVNLGQWPEALLCFYYFLMLENDSKRAVIAYESIVEQLRVDSLFMSVFISKTKAFVETMKARNEEGTTGGIWADFYIPLMEAAVDKGYAEELCYYISLRFNKEANTWAKRNEPRLQRFVAWLEDYCL